MAEVFRFVSLRGPAPLLDATKPLVVHVPARGQSANGALSPAIEKIALQMAGVRYAVSDTHLAKLLERELDVGFPQGRGDGTFKEMLTGFRHVAEYLYAKAARGTGTSAPGAGDAAAVQILTIEYIERVLAAFDIGSSKEQAERCRDFFLRSVLSVDLGARVAMTLPTEPKKDTRSRKATPAPAPPTATQKRELRLLRVAVARLVRNISSGGGDLTAELMTADEIAGFKLIPGMHTLTGELAMVEAEIQQVSLEKAEEKIRDRVAEMAALGDLSEGQPMPRAPTAKPSTTTPAAGKKESAPLRLGIGDLLMTELVSSAYAYGDIAHIENIMSGELRERSFRKSSSTETDLFQMTETEATTETDTQSTQRFELEKASEATLNESLNLDAGASISGTYGPVTAQASFGLASTTSREQSQKQSSKFAQEVVSKATQKVRQLSSRQERVVTKVVVEDNTLHSMANPANGGHISGIYRWVDKVDDLRLVDYGQRLMVGLTVPEPASYLRWLATRGNARGGVLPPPTVVRGGVQGALRPDDITPANYLTWLAAYSATDIEPPPSQFVTQSLTLEADPSQSAESPGVVTRADSTIVVPPGYRAIIARGACVAHKLDPYLPLPTPMPEVLLAVGSTKIPIPTITATDFVRTFTSSLPSLPGSAADRKEGGAGTKLPVVLSITSLRGFALSVEVVFERSDSLLEAWRIDTWAKIMNAYKAAVSEAGAEAARATLPGVTITGANPRENRALERSELKRQIMELMAAAIGSVDAVVDAADTRPRADAAKVASLESLMSYLDRAFEWEHMSWVLQDYFWAPETSWSGLLGSTDSDPLRQLFMRSGAASITLPVRRGFEAAVLYRVWTGLDWQGDHAPLPSDPAALALGAEVITSATGVPQQGREVTGSRWKERNPTSLVILQPDGLLSWVDEA